MKKLALITLLTLTLGAGWANDASASYWLSLQTGTTYANNVTIQLDGYQSGGDVSTMAGRFTFKRSLTNNGTLLDQFDNYFCADVAHSVGWNQWNEMDLNILPPDYNPNGPNPPDNIWLAGWVVEKYRTGWGDGTVGWGAGTTDQQRLYSYVTQLAVWEITHETGWASETASWWTGNMRAIGISDQNKGYVKSILDDAALQGPHPALTHYIEYYDPVNGGQGLLREDGEIPEPGSLLLLGAVLTAAGVTAFRRRRP